MEIRQLNTEVVDQIAAGEVVERPSHLLKELIENSLDAGSTQIEIEVNQGGRELSVTDNGRGVLQEDLSLVFARHATSKIEVAEDLWRLHSFGFRGEALASIAAVSKLDFISRHQSSQISYRIQSDYGSLTPIMEASHPQGTSVKVSGLFANIPARLKFLKSDAAELSQIKNVVKAMALQYPQVEWKLKNKGQMVFLFPVVNSPIKRAQDVLEINKLYYNRYEYEDFSAEVIFSDPSQVVKVSRQIWIFVQNRWVQDKGLQAAVMEAYRSLLMHGQYPICFVSLQCPADSVDVNIHPTKSQVKFVDNKKAFRTVYHALRQAIEKAPWHQAPSSKKESAPLPETSRFQGDVFDKIQFQKKSASFTPASKDTVSSGGLDLQDWARAAEDRPPALNTQFSKYEESFFADATPESPCSSQDPQNREEPKGYWSRLQVVGQVDLTYIVAQGADRMVLVDQHAAHERVAFERLMQAWELGRMPTQEMLLPLTLDLDAVDVEAIMSLQNDLEDMGVRLEMAGPESLAISSLPSFIREKGLVEALRKMAAEVRRQGDGFALKTQVMDIFATMACHSVIRAGQALSQEEMETLLSDMDEFPLSGYCPHGRSVSLEFPFAKLETDFGRRG